MQSVATSANLNAKGKCELLQADVVTTSPTQGRKLASKSIKNAEMSRGSLVPHLRTITYTSSRYHRDGNLTGNLSDPTQLTIGAVDFGSPKDPFSASCNVTFLQLTRMHHLT